MLGYRLGNYLSDEEKKLFTNDRMELCFEELFSALKGEEGSFAEMAEGDVDKALALMKAIARMRTQDPISSTYSYLFYNTCESETEFQLKVQAAVVKGIRSDMGLSQQEFSDLCELKKRSIENWEQGDRKITRCVLDYLLECCRSREDDLYSMVQLHTEEELSSETLELLKRLSECKFRDEINGYDASDYPLVRYLDRNMMYAPEYLIRVEREEYITDGKVTYKHDLFPEDLRQIMDYAVKKGCDEIFVPAGDEKSSYVEYMQQLQNK